MARPQNPLIGAYTVLGRTYRLTDSVSGMIH